MFSKKKQPLKDKYSVVPYSRYLQESNSQSEREEWWGPGAWEAKAGETVGAVTQCELSVFQYEKS